MNLKTLLKEYEMGISGLYRAKEPGPMAGECQIKGCKFKAKGTKESTLKRILNKADDFVNVCPECLEKGIKNQNYFLNTK